MRGRSKAEGIYIHIADSWCCTAETNIVKTLYFNKRYANSKIKILSWKKKTNPSIWGLSLPVVGMSLTFKLEGEKKGGRSSRE